MVDLTFIILTKNEEKNIEKCIKSLRKIAKRVVIVDSYSTDKTIEIGEKLGANVYKNKFIDHATQVNWGLSNANINTEWVMRIDADEELTEELANEIDRKLNDVSLDINGINIKRRIYFMGKWIKHGGIYPTVLLRIFRKGKAYCVTRYGNVMASRGSVIPLFVHQIRTGQPITVTDPNMTRYLMSLEEAVELVVYAFEHAQSGDTVVQKSPGSTVGDLAEAMRQLFDPNHEIKIIGTRHGEKVYETLLTKEEFFKAEDMGHYFRVPADNRDLNYDQYFVDGNEKLSTMEEYNSHNTYRLTVEAVKDKLLSLDFIRQELGMNEEE